MFELATNVKAWLPHSAIEPDARRQIDNIASMPFLFKHVAVMPDCHLGKGATVGTVIATKGAVIPAAVGVDIGCGMVAVRTCFTASQLPDNLNAFRLGIERRIPLGAGGRNKNSHVTQTMMPRIRNLGMQESANKVDYEKFANWPCQLGSLGSGNHFIEMCLDEANRVWIVLHSGSRGVGNRIADSHIKAAQRLMGEFFISLPDKDLAYLPEDRPEFKA